MEINKEAKAKIKAMKDLMRHLEYEIHEEVDRHIGEGIPSNEDGFGGINEEPHFDDAQWFYVSDEWDCPKSPFGWCMYHIIHDKMHNFCVFCHGPQERK